MPRTFSTLRAVVGRTALAALPTEALAARRQQAHLRLADAGAHYVVDGIGDLLAVLEDIEERLAVGERP
ncbi:MAG: hypothetical protein NZ528_15975 [Caldilineales bacterium]|nr:hypothetical protein [Caldilineales bacterium]MDW8318301.1 hypothetical protein [Anaerolineae bacterium]